jgi:hypothetical protein
MKRSLDFRDPAALVILVGLTVQIWNIATFCGTRHEVRLEQTPYSESLERGAPGCGTAIPPKPARPSGSQVTRNSIVSP